MNHSIYSADRMTHLKIVVVALVAGILVAGFGISTRNSSSTRVTPRRAGDEGRQAGRGHELQQLDGALTGIHEFTLALYSPPKSPRGYKDPNYPQVD